MIPLLSIYIVDAQGYTVEAQDFRFTPVDENDVERARRLDEFSCDRLMAALTKEHRTKVDPMPPDHQCTAAIREAGTRVN